jgi:signal transduction histidine kinase
MIGMTSGTPAGSSDPQAALEALQDANEKLESFAYLASHDLRSPLRAMMSLAEWLAEDLETHFGDLPKSIGDDLAEIRSQGKRMEKLLVDLLNYSRIQQSDQDVAEFDTVDAVRECIDLISPPRGFSVTHTGDLPRIRCNPVEFSIVIRNLISNALKHHDRDSGTITVSGYEARGHGMFQVRDDGPGFDPAHANEMFDLFRRFNSKEGNGIGLGMVRQITRRYGGDASSKVLEGGRGAVFTVSFPLASPSPATALS